MRLATNDDAFASEVMRDPENASVPSRSHVLIVFAIKLTRTPSAVTQDDLTPLRGVGLGDRGIHDLVSIIAYFNFVNRMAEGLGVSMET